MEGKASDRERAAQLVHGMNCPGLIPMNDDDCTCGLRWRIQLQTEQEMHNAWRKRAEQAERELAAAYKRGQEEMRERAALCFDAQGQRRVRALPASEEKVSGATSAAKDKCKL